MEDTILFLGTGGDSIVVGKQMRASGGIILKFGQTVMHLDPGPGALIKAKQQGINPRETTAVFVSHNHLNHCSDVNSVLSAMTYSGIDKRGILVTDEETLYGSDEEVPMVSKYHQNLAERFMTVKRGSKFGINNINIIATHAKHTATSVGYKFYAEKFTVSYTGDTAYCKELVEDHKDSDIIIINCKYPLAFSQPGHMNAADVENFLNKTKPKLAILTHFGIKMLDADPIYEAREIQKKTGVQVTAAKDGLSISPKSYANAANQRKLRTF